MSDGKVTLAFGADSGNVPQVVDQINSKLRGMAATGETAGAKVGQGLNTAGTAAAGAGTKFDRLLKAAGPLGGVLAKISPEAGSAAASISGLTGTAEAMAAGLGVSFAAAGAAVNASAANFSGANKWAPGKAATTRPAQAMPWRVIATTAMRSV